MYTIKRAPKVPVPEEKKDLKYRLRRKRNNEMAKKTRDRIRLEERMKKLKFQVAKATNKVLRKQIDKLTKERNELLTKKLLTTTTNFFDHENIWHFQGVFQEETQI